MDPAEEIREAKRQKDDFNMLRYVCDSQYGIPRRCFCGSSIIDEVRANDTIDTLPGRRFFTCKMDPLYANPPGGLVGMLTNLSSQSNLVGMLTNLSSQSNLCFQPSHVTEPNQSNQAGSSQPKPPLERKKWSTKEDLVLISAWLNTSKDPVVSNEQKATAFWKRIQEYYMASPQISGYAHRSDNQCKQRWGRINDPVCKWVGCYEAAMREQSSGQNDDDVIAAAHEMYQNHHGVPFILEHAWKALRNDQKWRSMSSAREDGKEKRKEAEEEAPDLEEARPPGVKASKAKRKKKGKEAAFDKLEGLMLLKENISKQRVLERLLARKEPLSEIEESLKNKLVSEML